MKQLVSILIPCYNAQRWIAQAIESALAQIWLQKEVIVIDNGSTDGSLAVIKSFGDRIRWETSPNRGANAARNRLLELARGDWLQYLDADDYLRPDKVAKQARFLQQHCDADILFSPVILEHWSETGSAFETTVVSEPHDPWVLLARWRLPGTGSGIWRKQALLDVDGWNEQQPCCQEHELYLRLLQVGKRFQYCPDGGYVYRQWGEGTVSKRNKPETNDRRLKIVQLAEHFLLAGNALTPARLQAFSHGRFDMARTAWQYDRKLGMEIMETIRRSDPAFKPVGQPAPLRYRMAFRLFGFQAAERLADINRGWFGRDPGRTKAHQVSPAASPSSVGVNLPAGNIQPLVSILIPCWNAEKWIGQAVESALGQTWPEKEVIVVDDGSTDRSLEIIKRFQGHIRWETGPNRGGNAARNRLLELARGEWLQYLDADDYLLPDKISNQMAFLAGRTDTDIVFGPVTMEYWSEQKTRRHLLPIPEPHDPWILLARWYLPQTGASLWRKQALLDVGGWKADQPCCQEHELYLRLLMAQKHFAYCSHNGAIYRQWSEQTICKRNQCETHRRRLEIENRTEQFLREREALTLERLAAINQTRFETARSTWQHDPEFAAQLMDTVRRIQPNFVPQGVAAPPAYRFAFRALGFRPAEIIADCRRRVSRSAKAT